MARKPLKVAAWVLGSVAGLLALLTVAVLVIGNTDAGRALIERITARLTGGMVNLPGSAAPSRRSSRFASSSSPISRGFG